MAWKIPGLCGSWTPLIDSIAAGQDWLAQHDEQTGERVADRLWSEVMWTSYARAGNITGDPLDAVPSSAAPHIRASAVWWLTEHAIPGDTFAEWMAPAEAVLARRNAPGVASQKAPPTRRLRTTWAVTHPWWHFLGEGRRQSAQPSEMWLRAVCLSVKWGLRSWSRACRWSKMKHSPCHRESCRGTLRR